MRPSLDEIVNRTAEIQSIPVAEIPALLCRLASVQSILLGRLAAESIKRVGEGRPAALLAIEDVCAQLKIQPDYLYRHWKKIPGTMKIAGKIRFTSEGLKRWTDTQRVR